MFLKKWFYIYYNIFLYKFKSNINLMFMNCFKIGKVVIDLRDWYQIWINKGDIRDSPNYVGWSKIWYLKYEIEDILHEHPEYKIKKVSIFRSIVNWDTFFYLIGKYSLSFGVGIVIGFIISKFI